MKNIPPSNLKFNGFDERDMEDFDKICWKRNDYTMIRGERITELREKARIFLGKYPKQKSQYKGEDPLDILCEIYQNESISSKSMKSKYNRVINFNPSYPDTYSKEICCARKWIMGRDNFETFHVANFHGGTVLGPGPKVNRSIRCAICNKNGSQEIKKDDLSGLEGKFFVLAFIVPMGFCNYATEVKNVMSSKYQTYLSNTPSSYVSNQYCGIMQGRPIHNPLLSFLTEDDIDKYIHAQNNNLKTRTLEARVFFQADLRQKTPIFNTKEKLGNVPLTPTSNICLFCLLKIILHSSGKNPKYSTIVLNNCLDVQSPFSYSPMHLYFKFSDGLPIETHVKPGYEPSEESIKLLQSSFNMHLGFSNRLKTLLGRTPLTCEKLTGQVKPRPTFRQLLRNRTKDFFGITSGAEAAIKKKLKRKVNNTNLNNPYNPKKKRGGGNTKIKKTKKKKTHKKKYRKKRLSVIKKN